MNKKEKKIELLSEIYKKAESGTLKLSDISKLDGRLLNYLSNTDIRKFMTDSKRRWKVCQKVKKICFYEIFYTKMSMERFGTFKVWKHKFKVAKELFFKNIYKDYFALRIKNYITSNLYEIRKELK